MTISTSADSRAASWIRFYVKYNVVGMSCRAGNSTDSCKLIQIESVAHPPCDSMIRARGVATYADSACEFSACGIKRQTASEHVDSANFLSDHWVIGLSIVG
jgi:hypothetical protein